MTHGGNTKSFMLEFLNHATGASLQTVRTALYTCILLFNKRNSKFKPWSTNYIINLIVRKIQSAPSNEELTSSLSLVEADLIAGMDLDDMTDADLRNINILLDDCMEYAPHPNETVTPRKKTVSFADELDIIEFPNPDVEPSPQKTLHDASETPIPLINLINSITTSPG